MMGTWGYGYMPFMGTSIFGFLLIIFFWIGIVWIVFSLMRFGTGIHTPYEKHSSAIRILEERYAKGEIDQVELEEKIKYLKKLRP